MRATPPEPGGFRCVRGVECVGPLGFDHFGGAVVHRRWGFQPDAPFAIALSAVLENPGADFSFFFTLS